MPWVRVWVAKFLPTTNPHPQRRLVKPTVGFVFWAQSRTSEPLPLPPPHEAKSPCFFCSSRSLAISRDLNPPPQASTSLGTNKYTRWTQQHLLIATMFVDRMASRALWSGYLSPGSPGLMSPYRSQHLPSLATHLPCPRPVLLLSTAPSSCSVRHIQSSKMSDSRACVCLPPAPPFLAVLGAGHIELNDNTVIQMAWPHGQVCL